MGKEKKYFVFDLDNTLVKTDLANTNSYAEAIKAITSIEIQIGKTRITREQLPQYLPSLSSTQISKIIESKEELFIRHIKETILNQQLIKILLLIKGQGEDTILLTECRERRAKELCSYWGISQFFDKQFYKENYSGVSKYQFLQAIVAETKSVVLFENEHYEIQKALKYNLYENQIIKVKF